jgi:hypothetical protein
MDLTTKLNIASTEARIAILRHLITTLGAKGHDVSEHRRMLATEERYLASGWAPPTSPSRGEVSSGPPPMGGAHSA